MERKNASSRPDQLSLVSYLAPNMFWFYEAIGADLERVLGVKTHTVQSQYDPLEDPAMLQDRLDVAFICGLPFVQLNQVIPGQLKALAAPVMQGKRYGDRPIYFSDIIVSANSSLTTFDDLVGKTWCYNDLGSNSGYNLVRQKLIQAGHPCNFFGKAIQSGSHQRSIRLVVDGVADCSAIDSTVLERELHDWPALSTRLQVIESIGPCPMPPVVVAQHLGSAFIEQMLSVLLQPDTELRQAMNQAQIRCYVAVESEYYTSIGRIYDAAIENGYGTLG